jgi:hypothetical protein
MERSGCGLIKGTIPAVAGKDYGNPRISATTVDLQAEI